MRLQVGDIVHPIDNRYFDESETMVILGLDARDAISIYEPIETTPYTDYLYKDKNKFYWKSLDLVLLTTIFRG